MVHDADAEKGSAIGREIAAFCGAIVEREGGSPEVAAMVIFACMLNADTGLEVLIDKRTAAGTFIGHGLRLLAEADGEEASGATH